MVRIISGSPNYFLSMDNSCRACKKYDEALELYLKALSICKKNYGDKHSLTSRSYQLTGDIYFITERLSDEPWSITRIP